MEVYKREKMAEGNCIVVNNSSELPLSGIILYGKSRQRTTTGAQLFPILPENMSNKSGLNSIINPDGSVTINGTPHLQYAMAINIQVPVFSPGIYFISGGVNGPGNILVQAIIEDKDGNKIYPANTSFEIKGDERSITLNMHYPSSTLQKLENYIVYPMVNKGDSALPIEPYTGGMPSPSPEYPQELESVGENGNIDIRLTNTNLYYVDEIYNNTKQKSTRCSCMYKDGKFIFNNFTGKDAYVYEVNSYADNHTYVPDINGTLIKLQKRGVKLVVKTDNQNFKKNYIVYYDKEKKRIEYYNADRQREEYIPEKAEYFSVRIGWSNSYIDAPEQIVRVFVTYIEHESIFEQPMLKTSILPLSNALPGIPVLTGGNYTDPDGQRWVCDTIEWDRASGKAEYVQRVKTKRVTDQIVWHYSDTTGRFYATDNDFTVSNIQSYDHVCDGISNCFRRSADGKKARSDDLNITKVNSVTPGFAFRYKEFNGDIDAWKQFLNDNEVYVTGALATPIHTPLTPEQLEALKQLRTFSPVTIVANSWNLWMKVKCFQAYLEVKTDWKEDDFFNVQDYNRIRGNLNEIRHAALTMWPEFPWEELGEDKTYKDYGFYADEINRMETDLEYIVQGTYPFPVGEKKVFYDNQPFIDWKELNRLEKACLLIYQNVQSRITGRRRLAFTLSRRRLLQC